MDGPTKIRCKYISAEDHRALPGTAIGSATRLRPPPLRNCFLHCSLSHQSSTHRQIQKVGLTMKILVLFDVARRMHPDETFSAESLKQEQKPTEADVLECLQRLGHEVETL